MRTATTNGLGAVVMALASWQRDGLPVQLHPGDLGWQERFGADVLADSLRIWSRDEEIVAIGLVDGDVIRMALAPSVDQQDDVARVLVRDLEDSSTGVLPVGGATVEARFGQAFRSLLTSSGWQPDEPWTPLRRDLAPAVEDCSLRIETVGPSHAEDRVIVQRAAFPNSTLTVDRWHTMTAGIAYQQARCLVGYDAEGVPVAAVTVWSAGPGKPGLVEPMGVHRDHRGCGHGRSITLAGAAALRDLGSSSALVATPSSNEGAVATYTAAGFGADPDVTDFRRPAFDTGMRVVDRAEAADGSNEGRPPGGLSRPALASGSAINANPQPPMLAGSRRSQPAPTAAAPTPLPNLRPPTAESLPAAPLECADQLWTLDHRTAVSERRT